MSSPYDSVSPPIKPVDLCSPQMFAILQIFWAAALAYYILPMIREIYRSVKCQPSDVTDVFKYSYFEAECTIIIQL